MADAVRIRVAVTSRDGVSVNERFHRAIDWFVFDWREGDVHFVERRRRPGADARTPSQRGAEGVVDALADCNAVLSLQFQGGVRRELSGKGIALIETRGAIPAAVREFVSQLGEPSEANRPDRAGNGA